MNRTAEYASGIGLDIGAQKEKGETPKKTGAKRAKRTACRCGSTDHLTSNHRSCKFNKKNVAANIAMGVTEVQEETI